MTLAIEDASLNVCSLTLLGDWNYFASKCGVGVSTTQCGGHTLVHVTGQTKFWDLLYKALNGNLVTLDFVDKDGNTIPDIQNRFVFLLRDPEGRVTTLDQPDNSNAKQFLHYVASIGLNKQSDGAATHDSKLTADMQGQETSTLLANLRSAFNCTLPPYVLGTHVSASTHYIAALMDTLMKTSPLQLSADPSAGAEIALADRDALGLRMYFTATAKGISSNAIILLQQQTFVPNADGSSSVHSFKDYHGSCTPMPSLHSPQTFYVALDPTKTKYVHRNIYSEPAWDNADGLGNTYKALTTI